MSRNTAATRAKKSGDRPYRQADPVIMVNAFHRWLITRRIYCERCNWGKGEAKEGTRVIKDEHGHDLVVCDEHAGNLVEHESKTQ